MSEQVDILLATYQGADYLEEQLESILTQTHASIHLWIRDDGSSDQTSEILRKWQEAYPHLMTCLPSQQNLGIKGNFSELMRQSTAPYVMFADQDDKWLPHKVEQSLDQLKALERQYGSHLPLLVHTDLKVVDSDLAEIAPSFWRYAGLNPETICLNRLLAQNVLTGCTMLMNRSLVDLAQPIPDAAIMHDWWIGLVAACFGHVHYVDHPTLLYRQHARNDTGAKGYKIGRFLKQTKKEAHNKKTCSSHTYTQASHFLERYDLLLSPDKKDLIYAYQSLQQLPFWKQKQQIIKYRFFKQGLLRNLKSLLLP